MKKIFASATVAMIFFCGVPVEAYSPESSGEIVHVDEERGIAHTDMNDKLLTAGDVVKVLHSGQVVAYLQVRETSDTVSQLVPFESPRYRTGADDFRKVTVGCILEKLMPESENEDILLKARSLTHSASPAVRHTTVDTSPQGLNAVQPDELKARQMIRDISDDLKGALEDEKNKIQGILDSMKPQEDALLKVIASLVNEINLLRARVEEAEASGQVKMAAEKASLEETVERLQANLQSARDEVSEKVRRLETLEQSLKDIERRYEAAVQERDLLAKKLAGFNEQLDWLHVAKQTLERERESLTRNLSREREERTALEEQIGSLREELGRLWVHRELASH